MRIETKSHSNSAQRWEDANNYDWEFVYFLYLYPNSKCSWTYDATNNKNCAKDWCFILRETILARDFSYNCSKCIEYPLNETEDNYEKPDNLILEEIFHALPEGLFLYVWGGTWWGRRLVSEEYHNKDRDHCSNDCLAEKWIENVLSGLLLEVWILVRVIHKYWRN